MGDFVILVAGEEHNKYADIICSTIEEAAKDRGTGIAKRKPEYIIGKISEGKSIIALYLNEYGEKEFAGFCYIETWGDKQYVANSGLIVVKQFRRSGLATEIKKRAFELSKELFPDSKIFGITTSQAVMKINTGLGYHPVPFSELTNDEEFWKGCQSCPNYDILSRTSKKMCLCTGMLYDPLTAPMESKKPLVVLAFSGGLDTSYCVKYFADEMQYNVYTVIVNTGGFTEKELQEIEDKAYKLGARKHITLHETDNFYQNCLRYMIFGNILRNSSYPLSVGAERVFQAVAIANYAKKVKANIVAHGSTGAGNDQVRFDVMFHIMIPDIPILTPIRDNKLSRTEEIEYLQSRGYSQNWEKARYSINKGIWGTTIGGVETLTSHSYLPEDAFTAPLQNQNSETLTLDFSAGELIAVNGKSFKKATDAIVEVSRLAQPFAIGRDIHVGDTIIGIKGRVGFEAAAPLIIIKSHHALEKHTLTKHQLAIKEQVSAQYGSLLHEGHFLDPAMRNIEKLLEDSQRSVTGRVFVELHPYRFYISGVQSDLDLMSNTFGKYGEENSSWSGEDVRGFAKISANQAMIYHSVNTKKK